MTRKEYDKHMKMLTDAADPAIASIAKEAMHSTYVLEFAFPCHSDSYEDFCEAYANDTGLDFTECCDADEWDSYKRSGWVSFHGGMAATWMDAWDDSYSSPI